MKTYLSLGLIYALLYCFAPLNEITVNGKIVDKENGEPIIQAGVLVYHDSILITTVITDFDGNFNIKLESKFNYNIEVRYVGYQTALLKGLIFDRDTTLIIKLSSGIMLTPIEIVEYKAPLIEKDNTSQGQIVNMKKIKESPVKNVSGVSSTAAGLSKIGESPIRGSRTDAPVYYLDGIRITGRNIPVNAHELTQTNPPKYFNPSIEEYQKIHENEFKTVSANPLSTFSMDVDRASYSNVRRFIMNGQKVPADAVRIEEMINYFDYNYPQPTNDHPYEIITEHSKCPWNPNNSLLLLALQAKKINTDKLPASHLTFLIDVSGSMGEVNKLPLVISSLKLLVNKLRPMDKVSLVVYAGASGMLLRACPGNKKETINAALDNLRSGGSTAGAAGIELAYKIAQEEFILNGNNRVILCTDGDFNVGVTNSNDLENLIVEKRKSNVFLTCLGFGMGNYKDEKLKTLADKGNGNYGYIDDASEAKKMFEHEFGGTIFTIAKDVKIQIEFNPAKISAYRLVGYEDRLLNEEDFKDDTKDAGEMGSGHVITALYELIPTNQNSTMVQSVDPLKYSTQSTNGLDEIAEVKTRYKPINSEKSIEYKKPVNDKLLDSKLCSSNFNWSSAVAMFGMILRNSCFKQNASIEKVIELANSAKDCDSNGYRSEFISMVKKNESVLADK